MTQSDGEGAMIIKNWHVALTISLWLVLCSMAFATLRAQSDENERRITELEHKPSVTLEQYQEGQRVLEQRLDRIERKLDASTDPPKRAIK